MSSGEGITPGPRGEWAGEDRRVARVPVRARAAVLGTRPLAARAAATSPAVGATARAAAAGLASLVVHERLGCTVCCMGGLLTSTWELLIGTAGRGIGCEATGRESGSGVSHACGEVPRSSIRPCGSQLE